MTVKYLFTAIIILCLASVFYVSVADAWAQWLAKHNFETDKEKITAEHIGKITLAKRLAPWDGVIRKRLGDMKFAVGDIAPMERFRLRREAEREYIAALKLAPAHYLTLWALGELVRRTAPNDEKQWMFCYRGALFLYPAHSALKKEMSARLYETAMRKISAGDTEEALVLTREAETIYSFPFWRFASRGAVYLQNEDTFEARRMFNRAQQTISSDKDPLAADLRIWLKRFLLDKAHDAVENEKWLVAKELFDLAGKNEPEIGAFLRTLDTLYFSHRDKIWGGKPYITVEDFEFEPALTLWQGTWRENYVLRRTISSPGYKGNASENILLKTDSIAGHHSQWKPCFFSLSPSDRVGCRIYVRRDKKDTPINLSAQFLVITPDKHFYLNAAGAATNDAGDNWTMLEFQDVTGTILKRYADAGYTIEKINILMLGVGFARPYQNIRVDELQIYLM